VAEAHEVRTALEAGADDAVSLEATGELPCFPTLKWIEAGSRGNGEASKLARRAAYLERRVSALEAQLESARAHGAIDDSTNLPGRVPFLRHVSQALATVSRYNTAGLIVVAELGGLDQVTDVVGDWVIGGVMQQLAQAFEKAVRGCDVVARVAPTRFAAVLTVADPQFEQIIGQRVRDAAAAVSMPRGETLDVRVATRILSADRGTAAEILKSAEQQLTAKPRLLSLGRLRSSAR
jgi:diguanylate cyclase (GGDEF)-like protein